MRTAKIATLENNQRRRSCRSSLACSVRRCDARKMRVSSQVWAATPTTSHCRNKPTRPLFARPTPMQAFAALMSVRLRRCPTWYACSPVRTTRQTASAHLPAVGWCTPSMARRCVPVCIHRWPRIVSATRAITSPSSSRRHRPRRISRRSKSKSTMKIFRLLWMHVWH